MANSPNIKTHFFIELTVYKEICASINKMTLTIMEEDDYTGERIINLIKCIIELYKYYIFFIYQWTKKDNYSSSINKHIKLH
jgi:hypothetical protein